MRSDQPLAYRAWPVLRAGLIHCGLSAPLLRLGLLGLMETRRNLALRYLSGGNGVEVGALHYPLPLPPGARALYVDKHAPETLKELRADTAATIIRPDLRADGFSLHCIAPATQDFVIANHVLEHATNALGTLANWLNLLRPDGILFVAVPRGERCFDRGRAITPDSHFMEDYQLNAAGNHTAIRERNRAHVEEHLAIAAPAIAHQQGMPWMPLSASEHERQVERLLGCDSGQIHHHVFTQHSFSRLLAMLGKLPGRSIRIERIARSSVEIVGIVRKIK